MIARLFWDSRYRRITMFWRLVIQMLLFVILTTTLPLVSMVIASVLLGVGTEAFPANSSGSSIMSSPLTLVILQAGILAGTMASVWVAGRFLDRRKFSDFGLRLNRDWWIDFAFGLSLGAILMAIVFLVEWAAGWITVTGTLSAPETGTPFVAGFFLYLLNFIAVGIFEELFSRGYQLKNMSEGFAGIRFLGSTGAILLATLLSSALFGYLHAKNPNATTISTFNLILAGLFLALGLLLTGELAIPIGLHITWNFFQGKVFGFPVSGLESKLSVITIQQGDSELVTGGAFGPEAGLVGIGAMILGSTLILLWVRARYGRAAVHQKLAEPDLLSSRR